MTTLRLSCERASGSQGARAGTGAGAGVSESLGAIWGLGRVVDCGNQVNAVKVTSKFLGQVDD